MASRILQKIRVAQHTKCYRQSSKFTPQSLYGNNCIRIQNEQVRDFSHMLPANSRLSQLQGQSGRTHMNSKLKNRSPLLACQKHKTTAAFKVLDGDVDTSSETFKSNHEHCKELEERVEHLVKYIELGGGEKGMKTHVERNKKVFVRDRLRMLLDDYENDFLEIGTLAGMGMEYGDVPSAGSVAGIGRIEGVWCMVNGNDATVKGGTVYPIGVKKQLRGQEIAILNRLPCVYLVDSGGAFLQLQSEIFPDKEHGGRAFYNEAIMSSMKIPQVAIVCGSCTAGGAYVPAMADETVIVHRIGTIFLGGPPLVFAATGEKITSEELGGATLHCKVSGVTDHFADTEEDAYETGRNIITSLNLSLPSEPDVYDEPLYNVTELTGLAPRPGVESECVRKIIARLVDGSRFQEFKTMYGPTLVTGFAHIQGYLVGIVANKGHLSQDAATKGAHFVEICCHRNIPIIFLQNTTADESLMEMTLDDESGETMGNVLRARAKMMATIACAQVPKLTIITGGSFGANNFAMCGRSQDPKFLFTWPGAQIGILKPEEAVRQAVQAKFPESVEATEEEKKNYEMKISEKIHQKASSFHASSRMWSDGIILPQHTRKVLGQCLSIVTQHQIQQPTSYGVIRM
ncbi:methylcrotonoyl-CoA carboxylase beta chain, mitochondrial-like [Amphiura filiformis]|uniref:methylcrotonoyl-CoA carboxylase beta chain, mitochondrial-like n=1 Tax=Amphiura filiformis TaxID=82378 RepID=UPI003B22103E